MSSAKVDQVLVQARSVDQNVANSSQWRSGILALKQSFSALSPAEKQDFLNRARGEHSGAGQLMAKGGSLNPVDLFANVKVPAGAGGCTPASKR